jgi:hypothetical protein
MNDARSLGSNPNLRAGCCGCCGTGWETQADQGALIGHLREVLSNLQDATSVLHALIKQAVRHKCPANPNPNLPSGAAA